MEARPLAGKCALVTGGARRIGREIALNLAAAGASVAITYHNSSEDALLTSAQIVASKVHGVALRCDLRDPAAVRATAREAVDSLGKLDLLVNNAGLYQSREFTEISAQEWDEMFNVNVRAAFLMTQACVAELKKQNGRIVNIGSLGGARPWITHVHYCASKAALHMLTQATAKALAPEISVNCVAPGMIDQGESQRNEAMLRFAEKTPMQRNGSAADVAEAVRLFATCPQFVTGQVLIVDGGLSL
jgi:NAD(P)-dependent dehydrogenase (short-subunit alcohol dehydrogenase family)